MVWYPTPVLVLQILLAPRSLSRRFFCSSERVLTAPSRGFRPTSHFGYRGQFPLHLPHIPPTLSLPSFFFNYNKRFSLNQSLAFVIFFGASPVVYFNAISFLRSSCFATVNNGLSFWLSCRHVTKFFSRWSTHQFTHCVSSSSRSYPKSCLGLSSDFSPIQPLLRPNIPFSLGDSLS